MKKVILLFFIIFYGGILLPSQTLCGGEIITVKNNNGLSFDFEFILYFKSESDLDINNITVTYSSITETVDLFSQTTPTPGIKKLTFKDSHTFPGVGATYAIYLNDTFPLPDLYNLENLSWMPLYMDLFLPGGPLYGLNALPAFENDLSENDFNNGRWHFNNQANDLEGDSLFYFFIDYSTIDYSSSQPLFEDYVFPSAVDSFGINNFNGEIIWDRPEESGNYLIGMKMMEFAQNGFFLSRQDRFWIIEVSEEDLITSIDPMIDRLESDIMIFPNPAADVINVLSDGYNGFATITIFDGIGIPVYKNQDYMIGDDIDIDNFPSGLYWLTLETANRIHVQSFVISR